MSTKINLQTTLTVLIFVLQIGVPIWAASGSQDAAEKKRQELLLQIQKLEEEKKRGQAQVQAKIDTKNASTETQQEMLARYQNLYSSCSGQKNSRCATILYDYGFLLYQYDQANYIQAKENYGKLMDEWEKTHNGPEPKNPQQDYSKALAVYEQLLKEYPNFPKIDEVLYIMAAVARLANDPDRARDLWEQLIAKAPTSPRAAEAYFRLADVERMEENYSGALKYLEKINLSQANLTKDVVSGAAYLKAEAYYNLSDYDKAAELFFDYIEKCEQGIYGCDLRDEALDNLAISFADMPDGAQQAIKFFKKVGGRKYQDMVLYTVGLKNRSHGQIEEAVLALSTALKEYPYYKDAPTAQQMLIECYAIQKKLDLANVAREQLVDNYGPNSEWASKNSGQKATMEQAKVEIKRALSLIPVYSLIQAEKTKDKTLYEKALKRFQEFIQRFPEEKWVVYEFHSYMAEIYNALSDYDKAAENFNFVAYADLSTYGKFAKEIDTLGMDPAEIYKAKENAKKTLNISQEDAGYNAIVALDNSRKKAIARKGVTEEQAYSFPETKTFLDQIHNFQKRFPQNPSAPAMLMLAVNVHYSALNYDNSIKELTTLVSMYPAAPEADKALILLAKCYTNIGEFDVALSRYKELLVKKAPDSKEYEEIVELASAALYKKAETVKKTGNLSAAADIYKSIVVQYPQSKVAERGYFDAAQCYVDGNNSEMAAAAYEDFTLKFPTSILAEKAFFFAAENYKKVNKLERAAKVLEASTGKITKADYAINALWTAGDYYSQVGNFIAAGNACVAIFQRYATDPKAPGALYQAGLYFEKARNYDLAISAYSTMIEKFPSNEYAADATFAMGEAFEKVGKFSDMAKVFTDYAKKYQDDKSRQVEALVRAGDAFFNMKDFKTAEQNYLMAGDIYDKFKKKADFDDASIAKAYYKMGEIKYQDFAAVEVTGANDKAVKASINSKVAKLGDAAKMFAEAIKIGVAEWTIRSTYMIGMGYIEIAKSVKGQPLFGSKEQKIAGKIMVISSLEKFYLKAQEYFGQNISWAMEQNITGEYVDKSINDYFFLGYSIGDLFEEIGRIWKSSPLPSDLEPEEKQLYQEELDEKSLQAMDMAVPKYEKVVQDAAALGVVNNAFVEKALERIREINPISEALKIQIVERKPQAIAPVQGVVSPSQKSGAPTAAPVSDTQLGFRDVDFDRSMKRIQNIISMDIPLESKISQLKRIETEAQRKIEDEKTKIRDLKSR